MNSLAEFTARTRSDKGRSRGRQAGDSRESAAAGEVSGRRRRGIPNDEKKHQDDVENEVGEAQPVDFQFQILEIKEGLSYEVERKKIQARETRLKVRKTDKALCQRGCRMRPVRRTRRLRSFRVTTEITIKTPNMAPQKTKVAAAPCQCRRESW